MKKPSQTCEKCQFYTGLGTEDSGLTFRGSTDPWEYTIGQCTNKKSVHTGQLNLPGWNSCEHWKRKKNGGTDG